MVNVTKRGGAPERFDAVKLARSIEAAGASEDTARAVAGIVPRNEGITTREIRGIVTSELREVDPEAARVYDSTRAMPARMAVEPVKGVVRLRPLTLERLSLETGDEVEVLRGDKLRRLRAMRADVGERAVELHPQDMRSMEVPEGGRVLVRRPD